MNRFILTTKERREKMLRELDITATGELFCGISEDVRIKAPFTLPEALGEYDLKKVMQNLAGRNISASDAVCFLGAGVYDHFVPSIVNKLTEYVAFCINGHRINECEGILQAVYELQIYMQRLTGMKYIAMFSGISAALEETIKISCDVCGKKSIVVSRSVNPEYRRLLKTCCTAFDITLREIGGDDGTTSLEELSKALEENCACVIVQSPNYFGNIEDMDKLADAVHSADALFAAVTDPISLALLKTPGEYNADITIGNGQPLGGALLYGAHYFAYMGVNDRLKEYIGEGIVTQSKGSFDADGQYATHLLGMWSAAVYLSVMGSEGIKDVARTCYSNACYTYEKLTASSAFKPAFNKPFFREFAVKATKKNVNDINNRMLDYGMIGGVALKNFYPELGNVWLVAVTEKRSADEVELFVKEASRSI